ncbi:precorrin-3B synthase [Lichenicola cladoniae]|uniref:Precorrin-3B synthase n=1 Tax=Lichenicola cladoniae TaxID=1484109 RepID=A0A6M8HMU3_9PROT|nr:precorrin-3B synthase [Lichenicola cladoniae]NPD67111.1 precorrin-3B synthase [Acetobacteraceae bacterium]QKE89647.1 precorrin-3B synthase [Lichenicola cladoniae]
MNAIVRGWCPSLYEPMQSGDGLLVRIKPSASRLDAMSARHVAEAALRHGNGMIELTNRGNLQLRGFSVGSAALFAREAVELGLAVADPAAERRRNIQASPLAGDDPDCDADTLAIARALEAVLIADDSLNGLPGKFGFAVDGGGALSLESVRADITLRASGPGSWQVEAGDAAAACTVAEAPLHAQRLARASLALPGAPVRPSRDPVSGTMLFQADGLPCRPIGFVARQSPVAVGPLPAGAFGIGVPPGRLDASLLLQLAALAEQLGEATIRLTPWRALVLAGLLPGAESSVRSTLAGQLLDPTDPRLRTASCIGAPACPRGMVPAPATAFQLGALLPDGVFLHVSGCAKGCAHPGTAPLTLVGHDGLYDLVVDGRAGDTPRHHGLTLDMAASLLHQHKDHPA